MQAQVGSGQAAPLLGSCLGNLQEPEQQLQTGLAKGHPWEGREGALLHVGSFSPRLCPGPQSTPRSHWIGLWLG